ncbi:MAG: ferredoxin [Firmicutes bacterium ADurb.Bin182]|nr:MAG: ferredoxin [Firmicutes bacterium ADurb.Bin182]
MSHLMTKSAYKSLVERINRFPQGAAPTDTLYKILGLLFTEKEARLVAQLPIKPFTPKTASKIWGMPYGETVAVLESLANRCILFDMETDGDIKYALPPPIVGFFEFTMMRVRNDIDQKLLSELFYQYLCVEEDFIKDLLENCETRFGRTFVNETALTREQSAYVLDFERATHIIETASSIGVSMCYCRHVKQHLGTNCDAPMDICLSFNQSSRTLIRHGFAREISTSEGIELLHKGYEHNLVQFGENSRNDVSFICNCCGCCCEALTAVKNFGNLHPIQTSNFIPRLDASSCKNCGKCVRNCPVNVIGMKPDINTQSKKATPAIDEDLCLGCGICVRSCPYKCLTLVRRDVKVITPANSVHRIVLMAIEKGKLQELLFDNKALFSHRALAAVLSAILNLPPMHRLMASKQMKSVYLDKLLSKVKI